MTFRLEALCSGYGRHVVIRDVTQTLGAEQVTAIVGPNGHGKSTLMATLSGLLSAMSGSIYFNNEEITGRSPQDRLERGIVHVPQGDRLFPDMTVAENLLIGGTVLANKELVRERLDWTLTMLPVVAALKLRRASGLSGGERRQVGIARALMTGRRFVMLDEPSLGLSPIAVESIYSIIGELVKQGYRFLIIEENLDRVYAIAAQMLFVQNGRIEWAGTASELKNNGRILQTFLGGHDVSLR